MRNPGRWWGAASGRASPVLNASGGRITPTTCLLALLIGTALSAAAPQPDVSVAADGTGQYASLQEAISAAPMRTDPATPRWVIFVKAGTYRERIYVQRERGNIHVIGEDREKTVIVYNQHANMPGPDGKIIGTFRTPTVQIDGDGMIWENLTLANDAGQPGPRPDGPPVAQALALRADGDRLVFRRCRFLGWQDTILVNRGRHYFADCYIEGHVDFIFGAATAYFDRCHIHVLKDGYITAASTPKEQAHGFVFADGKITGADGVKTYLGRPWRDFAKTVFLRTEMSAAVRPDGWHNWNKLQAELTTFYAEHGGTGPGASPATRVAWAKPLTAAEAAALTPGKVLAGADGWNPVPPSSPVSAGTHRDIQYGEAGGEKLLLDVSVPAGDGPFPVAILVHGGGWSRGDKFRVPSGDGADITPMFAPLTAAQYVWFSINYRHAPKHLWPACFEDVQTSIRWVKANAARFNGDPARIALFGHSAGGHLVCLAATLVDDSVRVQAVVGYAPVTNHEQDLPVRGGLSPSLQGLLNRPKEVTPESLGLLRAISPLNHVRPGLPPFLLIHGELDKTVPLPQSLDFQAKLRAAGVICDLMVVPGAGHGLADWERLDPDYPARMVAWLDSHLRPEEQIPADRPKPLAPIILLNNLI